ncbi:Signal recognition particle subunit srp72 [Erysiphe necator]|uniref:Signal recognition particle subunit SRP72 n=1 Tax=Uncinula necator TaxID=52586 RepID=A0A0B1P6K7_UNCNE|nr:Signal recognition particle subunit srp72 [Erysiphe necator]KHJ32586.1 putative signal recognition particle protein [Erysiphe necator]
MADASARLTALLAKISVIDNEEALDVARKALLSSKYNVDALHTIVVALLKLDRFKDALDALSRVDQKLSALCTLEEAYALYKTGKLSEAEALLQVTNKRGLKHVAAQVAYRAEKFIAALSEYRNLRSEKSIIEGEDNDLMVNISAIDAQLEWQTNGNRTDEEINKLTSGALNIFEISYNNACKYIAHKDFKTACDYLEKARELCEASDEMNEIEKKSEILPIMLQQAYVFTKLGKHDVAKNLLNLININELEPSSKIIAYNNNLVYSEMKNPFMAQRILSSIPSFPSFDQLFWYQTNILERNRIIADIKAQKYLGVARSTSKSILKYMPTISSHHNQLSVLNVAAYAKNNIGKAGIRAIIPLLEKRPNDVGLILTVVQLCVLINKPGHAIFRLENFLNGLEKSSLSEDQDVRFAPGLIALLISLYRLSGRKRPIKSILSKSATYWCQRNKPVNSMLYAACLSLLQSQDSDDLSAANELFKSMRHKKPDDKIALAGYIASCQSESNELASTEIDKLTPISTLISEIDIVALENNGVPSIHIPSIQSCKKRNKGNMDEEKLPAKKRKLSKKRMPKNYEEGKKVDPERWLAKKDRSDYRPRTKKGKKRVLDSMQGRNQSTNSRNKGRN